MGAYRIYGNGAAASVGAGVERREVRLFGRGVPAVRPARRGGWTLIEILVVIAVIAVLAGLTIPVASSMVASARAVRCASGLRAFGQAFQVYRQQNRDLYPFAAGPVDLRAGRVAPLDALSPHLDVPMPTWDGTTMNVSEPYRCPADREWAADTGFSYFYIPIIAMGMWAAESGPSVAIVEFSRKLGEKPQEPLLVDLEAVHQRGSNKLRVDGSVTR